MEALRTISLAAVDLKKKPVNATKDVTEKLLPLQKKNKQKNTTKKTNSITKFSDDDFYCSYKSRYIFRVIRRILLNKSDDVWRIIYCKQLQLVAS